MDGRGEADHSYHEATQSFQIPWATETTGIEFPLSPRGDKAVLKKNSHDILEHLYNMVNHLSLFPVTMQWEYLQL